MAQLGGAGQNTAHRRRTPAQNFITQVPDRPTMVVCKQHYTFYIKIERVDISAQAEVKRADPNKFREYIEIFL